MTDLVYRINGMIRLKVPGLASACKLVGIIPIKLNYTIGHNDPYFAGLV